MSLSEPPDILHKIFLYLSSLIFDQATIKLLGIIRFIGQVFNNSSIVSGFLRSKLFLS